MSPVARVAPAANAYLYAWGDQAGGKLGDGVVGGTRSTPVGVVPPNVPVSSVIAGHGNSSLALDIDGHLWAAGDFTGTAAASSDFVDTGLQNIRRFAIGYSNAGAIDAAGSLFMWGANGSGQLGRGNIISNASSLIPAKVNGLPAMRSVATTVYTTVAVSANGELWTWGRADLLGDGSTVDRSTPAQIPRPAGMGPVVDVQGVYSHLVALTTTGELWAWGDNTASAVTGDGSTVATNVPKRVASPPGVIFDKVAVSPFYGVARDTSGRFWSWGSLQGNFHQMTVPTDVVDIDTGYYFQIYRTRTGKLLGVGSNQAGQLGDGTTTDRTTPSPVVGMNDALAYSAGGGHGLAVQGKQGPSVTLTILTLLTCEDDTAPDSTACSNGGPDGVGGGSKGGEYQFATFAGAAPTWTSDQIGYAKTGSVPLVRNAGQGTEKGKDNWDTGDIYLPGTAPGTAANLNKVRRSITTTIPTQTYDNGKTGVIRVSLSEIDDNAPDKIDIGSKSGVVDAFITVDFATGSWTTDGQPGVQRPQYLRGQGDNYPAIVGFDISLTPNNDSDSDGLLDTWELGGIRSADVSLSNPVGGFVESTVQLPGANVQKRDIYVETDWTAERASDPAKFPFKTDPVDLSDAVDAFANAPAQTLTPATATTPEKPATPAGIVLHADFGSLGGGNQLPGTNIKFCAVENVQSPTQDFNKLKHDNFNPNRRVAFHYALNGTIAANKPTGCVGGGHGELGGNDFTVFNPDAGSWMHELGHNLGLHHAGTEGAPGYVPLSVPNNKPNYFSIMNYTYQFGLFRDNQAKSRELDFSPPRAFRPAATRDLSRVVEETINLQETVPVNPSRLDLLVRYFPLGGTTPKDSSANFPIDLNGNGTIEQNATGSTRKGQPAALPAKLVDHDDWQAIDLRFLKDGDSADAGLEDGDDTPTGLRTEADYVAEELERSQADLATVLTGSVAGTTINATVSVVAVTKLVYGPSTSVVVQGGTILDPLPATCVRVQTNEVSCTYGENAETVQPLEIVVPLNLTIKPTSSTVSLTASSRFTEPFNDTDPSNNTKTLTFNTAAVWSGSSVTVGGRGIEVIGGVRATTALNIVGTLNTITGSSTYGTTITNLGSGNVLTPNAVKGPAGPGSTETISAWRPGSANAVALGSLYINRSASCQGTGVWRVWSITTSLPSGVYYADCPIVIAATALTLNASFVSESSITVAGGQLKLTAATPKVLLLGSAIIVGGASVSTTGPIVTAGLLSVTATGSTLISQLNGGTVLLTGTGLKIGQP